tara:strand:- start:64 stop:684 length:621 start_codon:yes stop_codon:yes gene_type:complete
MQHTPPPPADFLSALDCDILPVLVPHCTRWELGRLLGTCRRLRAAGSYNSCSLWRGWAACTAPPEICAALRSSIVHTQRRVRRCMLDELRNIGCDLSSAVALPWDAGCALFASALHVQDASTARELLALVHADDLFEALLLSIKRTDPITVHYILRDIIDALDLGQCEQLREAAREAVVQGVEFGALYLTVRSCQTHRVVFDALYP